MFDHGPYDDPPDWAPYGFDEEPTECPDCGGYGWLVENGAACPHCGGGGLVPS